MTGKLPEWGRTLLREALSGQLLDATGDALASALDQLEALGQRHQAIRAGRLITVDRTREILERDRAECTSGPPDMLPATDAPGVPTVEATPAVAEPVCHEPIRTRTMAQLLASQGYVDRAVSIYLYLLTRGEPDPRLKAELATLQAVHAAAQHLAAEAELETGDEDPEGTAAESA